MRDTLPGLIGLQFIDLEGKQPDIVMDALLAMNFCFKGKPKNVCNEFMQYGWWQSIRDRLVSDTTDILSLILFKSQIQ
jgi:hypothetical protein